tara:strand:- start:15159 stop:15746 length:588 start_codon:yes stop_codon:yes gene_type:complete
MKRLKKNIILDLDETLISAVEDMNIKSSKLKSYDMDGYYLVFERPHLQKFLDYVFKNFNVIVWTAASKDYAIFIIKNILLSGYDRKLDYIFFRYHCDTSKKYQNGSKNLKLLWDTYKIKGISEENTIILDDYYEVHNIQEGNCVKAEEWNIDNKNSHEDDFFLRLIPLLEKFKKSKGKKPAVKINKAIKSNSTIL